VGHPEKSGESAVRVRGLRKAYGPVEAVRGLDLDIPVGQICALLGPNGAGKTTTVEILEGYRSRDAGEIEVLGCDPSSERARLKPQIGIVFQSTGVEPYLTVRETVTMYASLYPRRRGVEEVIELVGLDDKRDERVVRLSGGQQRRLEMAVALVGDPDLLFLDEPTTGFDPAARREAWEVVRSLAGLGKTIVLTTHYMDEADTLCDRLAIIDHGRIIAAGKPQELKSSIPGGYLLRLRFDKAPEELLGQLRELPGVSEVRSADHVAADIYADRGGPLIAPIVNAAQAAGAEVRDVHIAEPSLETLFLHHTGRSLRD